MQNKTTVRPASVVGEPSLHLPLPITILVFALFVLGLGLTIPATNEWWKIIILGVVQGLTEFLPISSTGHLLIAEDLLQFQGSLGGTFAIFIQIGTVFSVLAFYFTDLLRQGRALLGEDSPTEVQNARRLWVGVLVAFLPAAIIGVLFRSEIKAFLFESPTIIASSLIIGGIIFIVLELLPQRKARTAELEKISWKQALGVGVAQIFALVPGTSRSGSTIVGGLLAGLERRTATAFSFYLSIPVLGAATLVDLVSSIREGAVRAGDAGPLLLGAVVAFVVGWWSIGWLLRYVSRHSFVSFGIYRIIVGALLLGLVAAGQL
ncbi:MAG: undecaprenyl-diphosphate phosphatase [Chloroflexaceae bacterium]|nr:undecaprenyl-diphosphate phosphatase [Chloroflexaceae bacterium]